jgi:hypothetical protein
VKLIDGIEHYGRALSEIVVYLGGAESRGETTLTTLDVTDVGSDGWPLAVLYETEAREVETMMTEDIVEMRPRHHFRKLPRAAPHVLVVFSPEGGEELLLGQWL